MDRYVSLISSDVQLPVKRYFYSQILFAVIILYPKKILAAPGRRTRAAQIPWQCRNGAEIAN